VRGGSAQRPAIKSVETSSTLPAHSVEKRTSNEHCLTRSTQPPSMSGNV